MFEHLKHIRGRVDKISEDLVEIKHRLTDFELVEEIKEGLADSEAGRVTENNEVRRRFGLPELAE